MNISILGLTITSAWGNGHATTFRSLCAALHTRGHQIRFLEQDAPWYREHRDLPAPSFCEVTLFGEWPEAQPWLHAAAGWSDLVIIGSYFPEGLAAADYLFARAHCPVFFYDIDTPVTVERLRTAGETEALRAADIPRYDAYLSFTGGPILDELKRRFGARRALPLYCSVDPAAHRPQPADPRYGCLLSYLGTYAADRQPKLDALFVEPAGSFPGDRFLLAGAQYPESLGWPDNVWRFEHIPPAEHPSFYCSSRFTLNLTRTSMVAAGWSPSVRLFEAAACGAAIISDGWPGLAELLTPGKEVLLAENTADMVRLLRQTTEAERRAMGQAARARVLAEHTSAQRAGELEAVVAGVQACSEAG